MPFLHINGLGAARLDVIVKSKASLAVSAGFFNLLIGVGTADADAASIAERFQATGAESRKSAFIVMLTVKSTVHNHYLCIVIVNIRYGKSPLP
jgi:hypothetical protein